MKERSIRRSDRRNPDYRNIDGNYVDKEWWVAKPDTVLLLERSSKFLELFPGVFFWKVFSERCGIVYCQEANLEANSYEMME